MVFLFITLILLILILTLKIQIRIEKIKYTSEKKLKSNYRIYLKLYTLEKFKVLACYNKKNYLLSREEENDYSLCDL